MSGHMKILHTLIEMGSAAQAAIPMSGHMKTLHTLIEMGSAALAAAVPYPGKSD